jgi:hypothetical protein
MPFLFKIGHKKQTLDVKTEVISQFTRNTAERERLQKEITRVIELLVAANC